MSKERLKRLYAPYVKNQKDKWVRATFEDGSKMPGLFKNKAVTYYQDWLLAGKGELRPVPISESDYKKYQYEDYKL